MFLAQCRRSLAIVLVHLIQIQEHLIADGEDLPLVIHLEHGILTSVNYGACDIIIPVMAKAFETRYGLKLAVAKTQIVNQSEYCTTRRCTSAF